MILIIYHSIKKKLTIKKVFNKSSGLMSKIAGSKIVPESYTICTAKPYENGEIFNMFNNVASEAPTLSPSFKICTSF